jgi:hypothetical protein
MGGFYYADEDTDNQYPYCPTCYETSDLTVHLDQPYLHTLKCPKCGTAYPKEHQCPGIISSSPYTARDILRGY